MCGAVQYTRHHRSSATSEHHQYPACPPHPQRHDSSSGNIQHATCDMQHATCNMQHTTRHATQADTHVNVLRLQALHGSVDNSGDTVVGGTPPQLRKVLVGRVHHSGSVQPTRHADALQPHLRIRRVLATHSERVLQLSELSGVAHVCSTTQDIASQHIAAHTSTETKRTTKTKGEGGGGNENKHASRHATRQPQFMNTNRAVEQSHRTQRLLCCLRPRRARAEHVPPWL